MPALIDRAFCFKHPLRIARLFGVDILFAMLLSRDRTLLERIAQKYRAHRVAPPRAVGSPYKLAALFEFRLARIYGAMARRFRFVPRARKLFSDLEEEELEHGRLMLVCLHREAMAPRPAFAPSVRDPQIRDYLLDLRRIEHAVEGMTLEQALQVAGELEAGEVNVIFARLLKQASGAESELFAEQIRGAQSHPQSVPRRIKELKERLGAQRPSGRT